MSNDNQDFEVNEAQVTEMTRCNRCDAFEMMTLTKSRAAFHNGYMKIGKCSVCNEALVVEGC